MSRRIKLTPEGHRFRCRRAPCKNHVRIFAAYSDAEGYQSRHDVATHTRQKQAPTVRFSEAGPAWILSMTPHWAAKTLDWYSKSVEELTDHFGPLPLDRIEARDVMGYVQARRGSGRNATVRHLQTLLRVQRWAGVAPTWEIPRHEIRQRKKPKKLRGIERVRAILTAMPPGSLERDYATIKWLTLCRDVELREELRIGSWSDGVLRIRNRDKGGSHDIKILPLVPTALSILERRSAGRSPGEPLFTFRERPLKMYTLRERWRAAGAGNGVSWLRHEAVTIARRLLETTEETSTGLVSSALSHAARETTEQWYLLGDTERDIERRLRVFRVLESLLPPMNEGADPPPPTLRERISEWVQTQKGRAVSAIEISAALGVGVGVVRTMVWEMCRSGQVTRVARGRYRR